MKRLMVVLAVIGALTLLGVVVAGVAALGSWLGQPGVASNTILELNLEQGLVEHVPDEPVARALMGSATTVRDVVDALDRATDDDRVVGLIARCGSGGGGMARAQEIRDAIRRFSATGRKTVCHAETFGEFSNGTLAYYVSTAFDEIWLQPSGDVSLTGIVLESPFIRGTLEKMGVEPRMAQRHEYKNAMNMITETSYTAAHREAMGAIKNSFFRQMVRDIAESRQLAEELVEGIVDRAPILGGDALEAGLVDGIGYRDEAHARIREQLGEETALLFASQYLERAGRPNEDGEKIALIYGVGAVMRGENGVDPLSGEQSMGSDSVTRAFREAIDDEDVRAIVFRVDSPGGSYVASDTIWREVIRARESEKPVIVSMGDVAGSGGYFVAMPADQIVAQPGTITASIGVLGGKMLTTGMWDKIGMSWDEVHSGANARMFSGLYDYSPSELARRDAMLDRIYKDFTQKVADGRDLALETVLEIAKGRVWTGEDARRLGLVDELGGLDTALRLAKQAAEIPEDESVELQVIPRPKSLIESLMAKPRESSDAAAAAALVRRAIEVVRPYARVAGQVGLTGEPQVLAMPPIDAGVR